jgi:hypothetical protein
MNTAVKLRRMNRGLEDAKDVGFIDVIEWGSIRKYE